MIGMLKLVWLLTASFAAASLTSEEITEVTELCCAHAEGVSMTLPSVGACASAPLPEDMEPEQIDTCKTAVKECCEQFFKEKDACAAGMKFADSKRCNVPPTDIGKTCCEECSFGRWTGETQGAEACGAPSGDGVSISSALRKNSYYQCCLEAAQKPETTTEKKIVLTTTQKATTTTEKPKVKCKKDSCEHICDDEGGVLRCSCREGFRLQADKRSCADINECAETLDDLCTVEDTVCHNVPGAFKCVPIKKRDVGLGCPPGFKKNVQNQVCDDINECQLPRPPCPKYLCENTIGGYKCAGKPGKPFEKGPPGAPVTETTSSSEPPKNDICPPGFRSGDDDECMDIDECSEQVDDCQHLSQHCINTHGGFFCQDHVSKRCAPGFKVNTSTGICEDIDECEESMEVCKRTEVCVNLPGAYNCKSKISTLPKLATKTCQEGTRLRPGGKICEDIDECREGTHLCDQFQNCINTFGAHECRCKNGFELDSSSGSCVDIDECALKLDNCGQGLHCLNVLGSFTCTRRAVTSSTTTTTALPIYEYEYYDSDEENSTIDDPVPVTIPTTSTTTQKPITRRITTPRPTTARPTTTTQRHITTSTTTARPYRPFTYPDRPSRYPTGTTTTTRRPYTPRRPTAPEPTQPNIPEPPELEPRPDEATNEVDDSRPVYNPHRSDVSPPEEPRRPTGYPRPEDYPRQPDDYPTYSRRPENTPTRPETTPTRPETTPTRPEPTPTRPETAPRRPETTPRRPETNPRRPTSRRTTTTRRPTTPVEVTPPEKITPDNPVFNPNEVYCLNGYEKDEYGNCIDINECESGSHVCGNLEVCLNKAGGYTCECVAGFRRGDDGWCAAIVSSTSSTSTTSTTTEITTVPAYYPTYPRYSPRPTPPGNRGYPPIICELGFKYEPNLGKCVDIDECSTNKNTCSTQEDCINIEGGYRCNCGRRCRVDNERPPYGPVRPSPRIPSDPSSNVITVGAQYGQRGPWSPRPSYSMLPDSGAIVTSCPWGYKLTPEKSCLDIDECAKNISECGPEQRCENFYGGYSCQCPAGHKLVGQNGCEDIDECVHGNPCAYNARCINAIGSYRCECSEGFRNAPSNDKVCVDVDECSETPGICDQGCANAWGGYRCYCKKGYRLDKDNRTCVDVNECEEWTSVRIRGKLCGGECVNEPGSYRCACPAGYRLSEDHRSCIDIDECDNGEASCAHTSDPGQVCQNTRGSYHCHRIDCPSGYRLESRHRCSRIQRSCPVSDWGCLQQPSSYSYNFITFVANIYLPSGSVDLFTMHGPAWSDSVVSFEMRMVNVQASRGVKPADLRCFDMRPTGSVCVISLLCSLEGPQVAELELTMSLYQRGMFAGSTVARLVVIVSEYEF